MNTEVPNPGAIHANDTSNSPRATSFYRSQSTNNRHSMPLPSKNPQLLRTTSSTMARNPSPLSWSASLKSHNAATTGGPAASVLKSASRRSGGRVSGHGSVLTSSSSSNMNSKTVYFNSNGVLKLPAMEQTLECTLEEICFGCMKKIKITRDIFTNNGYDFIFLFKNIILLLMFDVVVKCSSVN